MKIAITGHTNIEKALGFDLKYDNGVYYNKVAFDLVYHDILDKLKFFCKSKSLSFEDITLISGMARGIDEVFAIIAIRNNIKLILSIPGSVHWHKNRGLSRGMHAQAIYYDKILSYNKIVEIFEIKKSYGTGDHKFVNMARNQHMVDISDSVFSFKAYSSAGTDDCIRRANIKGNYIANFFE